ncbi:hypothetical protein SLEP1_g59962 [Rubroshorea leprosula]|uniref:FAZ1 C-terminal region domain-containing protein n=1 Tax=Rubroshorea leprosula TaxID=152421 RepID=A0AAV5MV02_9ROSI|nr:hypothetical protein SLEP1_g59962 [Rubroshorea leprosula]
MANSNMGGNTGCYENEHFFYEVDPDVFSCDELIPNTTDPKQNPQQVFDPSAGTNELFSSLSTNGGGQTGSGGARLCQQQQCHQPLGTNALLQDILLTSTINQGRLASPGAQPWLQQQLGQPPAPEGYLQEPWINQGQGIQAAAATESLIAQQHSGQSSVPFTGDPRSQRNIVKISALDSLVKKRRYDKTYREKVKKQKQDLVYENGRLKLEIEGKRQQMKSELEASEVENGRLKFKMEECEAENGRLEFKLEEFEAENGRLKSNLEAFQAENGRLTSKLGAFEAENGRLRSKLEAFEAENGRLRSKLEEFDAENGRFKSKLEASEAENGSLKAENGRLKSELEASKTENEILKSKLETNFGSKLWDEIDSLKGNVACLDQRTQTQYACLDHRMQTQSTELAELQNKFDKLELKQQNWRTKKKSGMSSTEEFVAQIQENDSVDAAQNIPIISAAKEAEFAREEGINQAHLNWQSQKWKVKISVSFSISGK